MHSVVFEKRDGRRLWLHSEQPAECVPQAEGEGAPEAFPHLRWHPLRQEWVIYAAHRGSRTYHPPPEYCPLCPTQPGGFPTEIPFSDFDVAVFENRFPSLHPQAPQPPELCVPTAQANGVCEVVVYTAQHAGSLATLSAARRELLVEVWVRRYEALYAEPQIQCVMPFENRGEEVGVTLHHPHGQIYAYPFIPPVLDAEARAFRQGPVLADLFATMGDGYVVDTQEDIVAVVPPFARFPYELWLASKEPVPGPWVFSKGQRRAFAAILGRTVARYDRLFGKPFPYVMSLHASPRGEEATFHFHVEFYPKLRSAGKLKHLAGTELGAGAFAADALPEEIAQELREVQG